MNVIWKIWTWNRLSSTCPLCQQPWHVMRRMRRGSRIEYRIICRCGLFSSSESRRGCLRIWRYRCRTLERVIESGRGSSDLRTHANRDGDGFSIRWYRRWLPSAHDSSRWNIRWEEVDDADCSQILHLA